MKTFTIIFLTVLSFSNSLPQWITQTSGTFNPIYDIEAVNDSVAFASGSGIILKTTNRGVNWTILTQPATNKSMYSISPVNENIIYCVGFFETILKSTNGGANWLVIRNGPFGSGASYDASYFLNESTGWIAGSSQKILKTTNGGISFDSIPASIGNIHDIYFRNNLEGNLCGEGGTLFRTTNGGLNWFRPIFNLHGNLYNFYKFSFVNDTLGFMAGNGYSPVYRTTNFGVSWDSISSIIEADETYCIEFGSKLVGYSGGTYGRTFKTTDGGFTWKRENTGEFTGFISSFAFLNDSLGWVVGGGGRIQYTTNGGETLVNIFSNNANVPEQFTLHQNYPNPFNNSTVIKFEIKKEDIFKLEIFNILGVKQEELLNQNFLPGIYSYQYNGNKLSSGVFYYRLSGSNRSITKSFIILK